MKNNDDIYPLLENYEKEYHNNPIIILFLLSF